MNILELILISKDRAHFERKSFGASGWRAGRVRRKRRHKDKRRVDRFMATLARCRALADMLCAPSPLLADIPWKAVPQ